MIFLFIYFFLSSLSPLCPSSPLLFTHRQLSQFPNAVIALPTFFVLVLSDSFKFILSRPLSCGLVLLGEEVEAGGGKQRRGGSGGCISSFMTNHMCF